MDDHPRTLMVALRHGWFTSLLKRWLLGTRQGAVSREHLHYYLDGFTFWFNPSHRALSRAPVLPADAAGGGPGPAAVWPPVVKGVRRRRKGGTQSIEVAGVTSITH